jgi:glycosyltransferase involved in cell wall biosynthesis
VLKEPPESLVTVVIYTFNQFELVGKCLEGVLAQEPISNLEMLVIDDASTDETLTVCRTYQEKYPGKIQIAALTKNELSMGIFVGLDKFRSIRSKYIAFCDGDDYWVDRFKIQNQIKVLDEDTGIGLVHSDFFLLKQQRDTIEITERPPWEIEKSRNFQGGLDLVKGNHIKHSTMMIRRNLVDFEFLSKSRGIYINDWLICISVTQNHKVKYISDKTSVVRISEKGIWNGSNAERNQAQKNRLRWYCAVHLPDSKLRDAFRQRVLIDWTKQHVAKSRYYKIIRPFVLIVRYSNARLRKYL